MRADNGRLRFNSKGVLLLIFGLLAASIPPAWGAANPVKNVALAGMGAKAHSWEPSVRVVAEHEPARAIDGSLHTYWAVKAADLPADLGVEWPEPQTLSSVVVRYLDGRMVRGPAMARTQQWVRLQYWDREDWTDIDAQVLGQETSSVRYTFPPITTQRLRLLFTEPPDPESRRTPDDLGIYVCELEAYREAPFQFVMPSGRLVTINRSHKDYNEWGSDNSYDLAGALVIEPQQTRIFTDTLSPTLIVSESRWTRASCSVDSSRRGTAALQNGFLRLEVSTDGALKETRLANLVTGESVSTPNALAFRIRTSAGDLLTRDFKLAGVDSSGSSADSAHLRVDLTSPTADVSVHYELKREDHFYHKWLTLTNKGSVDLQVLDVTVSSLGLPRLLDLMAGPELTYPIFRQEKGGFFTCLETVYWDHQGDALTYYPAVNVGPGKAFASDKAVVGVYRHAGEPVERFDRGVRDWVIEYHAHVSPIPKEWPDIYLEGWSAKFGMQEMVEQPEWTERFFTTAHKMGVRYMDTYEPTNLALLMPQDLQKRWVELADRNEIGTGWWNDFGSEFGWGFMVPYFKPYLCKLSPEAEEYFQQIVQLVGTYKLRGFHWADFWTVWPCDNPNHGHLPGKYSIYAQGQRMIRLNQEMHEASPGLVLGADSGLDNPQYGRYADSRHHGGGYDTEPSVEPDIHLDRLYAEMNRDYLYGLAHESLLRPWFRLLNCVNHFGMETHHHDLAGYRYALLSAISMAPQLTFNDAPDDIPESDIEFTRKWEKWAIANKDYLKEGDRLFDRTFRFDDVERGGDESLTGYAHLRGDRGYVSLLNPGAVEQIAELTLALAAPTTEKFVVEEIYPGRMTLQGPDTGQYPQGGKLRVTVPAKQVRILWISPASAGAKADNVQPEDARAPQWRRYVGDWSIVDHDANAATLRARFDYPSSAKSNLTQSIPESVWVREPWNHSKGYLVFLLKDETKSTDENWVPDGLASSTTSDPARGSITVKVNGIAKTAHPFLTGRRQEKGMTRCYFIDLGAETKPGESNDLEVRLPIQRGLTFSGAYLDLPDQVPYALPPG